MLNYRVLILVTGFCIVAMTAFAVGMSVSKYYHSINDTGPNPEHSVDISYVRGLTSENLKDREKAAQEVRNKYEQLIKELIRLAGQEVQRWHPDDPTSSYPWHDSKHLSILLLGDLRAIQAVPILIENLAYKNPREIVADARIGGSGGYYPAAEALSKIGLPAVGSVIDKLGKYGGQEEGHRICCWIIREILGPRLGKVRLEMAIEETKDDTVKKNLTAELPYFKTEKEKADEERARREKAGKQSPASKTEK